jgi:hypothetical protein
MKVSDVISTARTQGSISTDKADNTEMLIRLNLLYKEVRDEIVNLDKNYGRGSWFTDFVASNNTYNLMRSTS